MKLLNERIQNLSALVMPQLVIDEHPLDLMSEESVIAGREAVKRALIGTKLSSIASAGKLLIVQLDERPERYSIENIRSSAYALCTLMRSWQRNFVPVTLILEIDIGKLLECGSNAKRASEEEALLKDTNHLNNASEAGKYNRSIMSVRALFCELSRMDLHIGVSLDDPLMPQYFGDQMSWCCFREENVESQLHRQLASAMSMPVAFAPATVKNGPGKALDACLSGCGHHSFFSMTKEGVASVVCSAGNQHCHIVMQWEERSAIQKTRDAMIAKNVLTRLMVHVDSDILQNKESDNHQELIDLLHNDNVAGLRVSMKANSSLEYSEGLNAIAKLYSSC